VQRRTGDKDNIDEHLNDCFERRFCSTAVNCSTVLLSKKSQKIEHSPFDIAHSKNGPRLCGIIIIAMLPSDIQTGHDRLEHYVVVDDTLNTADEFSSLKLCDMTEQI